MTWQGRKNGEPNLASPWVERLEVFHELAYGSSLRGAVGDEAICLSSDSLANQDCFVASLLAMTASPAPVLPSQLVPTTISASGYNSLMACPYQFYARHALHLNELDEVQQRWKRRITANMCTPSCTASTASIRSSERPADAADVEQALARHQPGRIPPGLEADYVARAWALRWEDPFPPTRLAAAREQEGWRWQRGRAGAHAGTGAGRRRSLTLKGRIDRVDTRRTMGSCLRRAGLQDPEAARPEKEAGRSRARTCSCRCYALLLGEMRWSRRRSCRWTRRT